MLESLLSLLGKQRGITGHWQHGVSSLLVAVYFHAAALPPSSSALGAAAHYMLLLTDLFCDCYCLQSATAQMTSFNAQQYAKCLSGLAALNLAPPAELQEVLCDPVTAQRIVGSAQRVSKDLWRVLDYAGRLFGVAASGFGNAALA